MSFTRSPLMDNYKIGDEVELLEDFYTRSGAEIIFKKGTIAKVIELQLYDEIHIDVNGDNRWCSPDILKLVDKKDPALISGDVALANVHKCIVQYLHDDEPYGRWTTITDHLWSQYHLGMFLDPDTKFKFRFKPQTIKLELELPKPFEPEEDCHVYILDDGKTDGYRRYSYEVHGDKGNTFIGIWRTEDEIKQVVEQLRKIRGTNS
ncbi:hypothetical protein [Acinetobacter baumannii]|uniref:hypothetical protein n=1 Tax=Acinetobacter baumannii TaxID=470 RepID=UPI001D171CC3|nr:hypothetical protein [Acinetobacter baumannii]